MTDKAGRRPGPRPLGAAIDSRRRSGLIYRRRARCPEPFRLGASSHELRFSEEDALKRILILAAGLCAFAGCGSSSKGYCNKAKECCSAVGANVCTQMNTTGAVDRCAISVDDFLDTLGTYSSDACNKVKSAEQDFLSCMSGISCSDINTGDHTVPKCQSQASAACTAMRTAGGACGQENWATLGCDNYKATFN